MRFDIEEEMKKENEKFSEFYAQLKTNDIDARAFNEASKKAKRWIMSNPIRKIKGRKSNPKVKIICPRCWKEYPVKLKDFQAEFEEIFYGYRCCSDSCFIQNQKSLVLTYMYAGEEKVDMKEVMQHVWAIVRGDEPGYC